MTPRERLLRSLRGETVDRVPLDLSGLRYESVDALSNIQDPLQRRLAERAGGHMHFEMTTPSHTNRYLMTPGQRIRSESRTLPNGHRRTEGVIDTPKGELTIVTDYDPGLRTGWTEKYPVESMADIEKIRSVPWERPPGVKPPVPGPRPADFDQRGIMTTRISSPFVCVAGMMRYEDFLAMCATDLDLIEDLTQICLDRTMDVLEALLAEPGIEYVWMGGSEWITPPMGSPAHYDALVQEQERRIIDYVHSHSDAVVHVHCHGRVRHALGRCIERGADYTEPVEPPPDGDITMADAKAMAAGRITLGGNLECRVLCNESVEAVEAAVRAAFEGGRERFVLRATENPSPTLSQREFENYVRAIDLWEELSPL